MLFSSLFSLNYNSLHLLFYLFVFSKSSFYFVYLLCSVFFVIDSINLIIAIFTFLPGIMHEVLILVLISER